MSRPPRVPSARVSGLRALSIILAFVAAVGLVFGTAGFSAIEADRGVVVTVTDDDEAYLGYDTVTSTVNHDQSTDIVEYHNQFTGKLTLNIMITVDGTHQKDVNTTLDPGDKKQIELTLSCSETDADVSLQFNATGSGPGVTVSQERTHTVTCNSPDSSENTGSMNSTTTDTTMTTTSAVARSNLIAA